MTRARWMLGWAGVLCSMSAIGCECSAPVSGCDGSICTDVPRLDAADVWAFDGGATDAADAASVLDVPSRSDDATADDVPAMDAPLIDGGGDGGPDAGSGFDAGGAVVDLEGRYLAVHQDSRVGGISTNLAAITIEFDATPAPPCTDEVFGPCRIRTCGPSSTARVSGGPVATESPSIAPIVMPPRFDGSGYDAYGSTSLRFWAGSGETLSVNAAGAAGGVPAFAASLPSPVAITLTAPAIDAGPTFDRATDLTFRWTVATAPADQRVELVFNSGSGPRLTCEGPAAPRTLVVPTAGLSRLTAGTGGLVVSSFRVVVAIAGRWNINVRAEDRIVRGGVRYR